MNLSCTEFPGQMRREIKSHLPSLPIQGALKISCPMRRLNSQTWNLLACIFPHQCYLVLLAVRGCQLQPCLAGLQRTLQHALGRLSWGNCLRLQGDLMNRKITLWKQLVVFRLLDGGNVNEMLKISWFKEEKSGTDKLIPNKVHFLIRHIPPPVSVLLIEHYIPRYGTQDGWVRRVQFWTCTKDDAVSIFQFLPMLNSPYWDMQHLPAYTFDISCFNCMNAHSLSELFQSLLTRENRTGQENKLLFEEDHSGADMVLSKRIEEGTGVANDMFNSTWTNWLCITNRTCVIQRHQFVSC